MSEYDPGLVCIYMYYKELQDITNVCCVISCAVSTITLGLRLMDQASLAFPGRLATQTVAIGVAFSFNLLLSCIVDYRQMEGGDSSLCKAQGAIFQFLSVAFLVHWAFIGYVTHLVVVQRLPIWSVVTTERWFHVCCWPFCLVATLLPIATEGSEDAYGPNSGIPSCYLNSLGAQVKYIYGFMSVSILVMTGLSVGIVSRFLMLAKSEELQLGAVLGSRDRVWRCVFNWALAFRAFCCCDDR